MFETTPSIAFTRHVFKPTFHAATVQREPSYGDFVAYLKNVLKNQVKSNFKTLFLTDHVCKEVLRELEPIRDHIYALVSPPKMRKLALPINQAEQI